MKAYPQAQLRGDEPVDTAEHGGMDLRDYFAAKAMQAEMRNYGYQRMDDEIAKGAYAMADAMMKARQSE